MAMCRSHYTNGGIVTTDLAMSYKGQVWDCVVWRKLGEVKKKHAQLKTKSLEYFRVTVDERHRSLLEFSEFIR